MNNLPPNWSWVKLGDVFYTTSGGTPSRGNSEYYNGTIPWVKSGELDKGLILDTEEKISEEALKNSSAKLFPKGTLLIALYGATIGKLAFLGIEAATNQAVCGIYKNENINSNFLFNFLSFKKQYLVKQSIGGAQPNISQGILKNLEIPLPPLPEQKKIVEKIEELFSGLDSGVASLKKAKEQIRLYRQSVLASAFSGKLLNAAYLNGVQGVAKAAEPKVEYSYPLPDGWKWVKLSDVCEKIVGGGTPSTKVEKYWNGNISWITSADIYGLKDIRPRKKITKEAIENSATNLVTKDTIIVVTRVSLGRLAITNQDICFSQDCQGLILKKGAVSHNYVLWFLSSATQIFKYKNRGTTIKGVTKKQLADLDFVLPPLKQQIQIVEEIEKRFSEADNLEKAIDESLAKSETLRQSILKKAFEGKLV